LVDPYEAYIENGSLTKNYVNAFIRARERLQSFGQKAVFIPKTSVEAINDVPNDLDFVYIDGNHTYEYVKSDVENYYPKVKSFGVIGGHDFRLEAHPGVVNAVAEFAAERSLKLHGSIADWWAIK